MAKRKLEGLRSQNERRDFAKKVARRIARGLPRKKEVDIVPRQERVSLKHPWMPKGAVASIFCRTFRVHCLLPVLGPILKINKTDRSGNPVVSWDISVAEQEGSKLGRRIGEALKSAQAGGRI